MPGMKKKAGRPKLGKLTRNHQSWFRTNKPELVFIKRAAKVKGLSPTHFARYSCLFCAEKILKEPFSE